MKRITALLLTLLLVMGSVLMPSVAENEIFEEKAPALTEEGGEENVPEAAGTEEKGTVPAEEKEEPVKEPAQEEEEEPEEPEEEPKEPAEEEPEEEPAPAAGDETPAGEPEGEPESGEPEGAPAGEPAGEPAPSQPEPAKFTEGYVLLKKNAVICSEMNPKKKVGKIMEDSYAWARLEDEAKDPAQSWLSVTFDTADARKKGEPLTHGYVLAGQIDVLTKEESDALEQKLEKDGKAREHKGHKIPAAAYAEILQDSGAATDPDPEVYCTPSILKIKIGETARFYVSVKNAEGEPAYQWQSSADEGQTWTDFEGETQSMIAFEVTEDNKDHLFRCVVRADGVRLTGPVVRLNIAGGEIVSNGKPSIKTSPKMVRTVVGTPVKFTAAVKNPKGEVAYQWQYSTNKGKSWKNAPFAGNNTAVMTVTITSTIAKKYSFRCVAMTGGKKLISKTSSVVAVKASVSPASVKVGKKVKFKAAAYNYGKKVTYQWYVSKNGGKSWKKYKGKDAKKKKITVKTTRGNIGYQYRCRITTSYGKLNTNAVSVKEKPRQIAVVIANNDYYYQNDLSGVYRDGSAMYNTLTSLGWEVRLVRNATAAKMDSSIRSAFSGSRPEDTCLVYYSGHGATATGSLCGINCTGSSDLYSPASLRNTLLGCTKGKVIVLMDSCGSGAGVQANGGSAKSFTNAVMQAFSGYLMSNVAANTGELLQNRFAVLAACETGKTSVDGFVYVKKLNGRNYLMLESGGVFTYSLVRSMGCSYPGGSFGGSFSSDSNLDGKLSLQEAYKGVKTKVSDMKTLLNDYGYKVVIYNGDYYLYDVKGKYDIDQEVQMGGAGGTVLFHK